MTIPVLDTSSLGKQPGGTVVADGYYLLEPGGYIIIDVTGKKVVS